MTKAIVAGVPPRLVPMLLAYIAGFLDICTYLGLVGVFVAQLTGSLVMVGSGIVSGRQELLTVMAIPTFFVAGGVATALAVARSSAGVPLRWVLALECALLTAMLALMLGAAPLGGRGSPAVIASALLGIAAMGVQSAMVRLFMKGAPSTNVMTSNTTQLAIDVTILLLALFGRGDPAQSREARDRLGVYWLTFAGFLSGTASGWLAFDRLGLLALAAPLAVAYGLLAWTFRNARPLRMA
jgi:uncharacterized membrane protein YoaK (UPF0700 family)